MNGKQIALFAGLLISVALTGWLLQNQGSFTEQRSISPSGPDLFVEQMDLKLIGEDGELRYRVQADRMDHFPHDDHSELTRPLMHVFEQQQTRWKIHSERGRIESRGETVWLLGQVEISQFDDTENASIVIHTRDLLVKPEQETAETDNAAVIQSGRYRVESKGFHADFISKQLELKSQVRGTIDVAG